MSLLDRILTPGVLSFRFQPIWWIGEGELHPFGVEALARGPKGSNLRDAGVLFEYVRRKRSEPCVDRVCINGALETARSLPEPLWLAINIHAVTLSRSEEIVGRVEASLARSGFPPERLILEIVEHGPHYDGAQLRRNLAALCALGVQIAVDDIGIGYSNFQMLLDVLPHLFKVDRSIVAGCHADAGKRAVLRGLVQIASELGGRVVAEGVELAEDLEAVARSGVGLVQGNLLGHPRSLERSLAELGRRLALARAVDGSEGVRDSDGSS